MMLQLPTLMSRPKYLISIPVQCHTSSSGVQIGFEIVQDDVGSQVTMKVSVSKCRCRLVSAGKPITWSSTCLQSSGPSGRS